MIFFSILGLLSLLVAAAGLVAWRHGVHRDREAVAEAALRKLDHHDQASTDAGARGRLLRAAIDEERLAGIKAKAEAQDKPKPPRQKMPMRPHAASRIYHSLEEAPDTPQITRAAQEAFARCYPDVKLQPLVVVIAAYNESDNIGEVLDEIPDEIAGVRASRLVIDDGSTDGTTEVAQQHGAIVCTLSANRGHGVALRLGYRIAREAGACYIATLDGDGQWNPADLPAMVRILEEDRADFVVGSRQLGRTENTDRFRNVGVRFFARVISFLTGTKLTDTSSGLRLMRAGLTGAVRQTQPQYQTSELLIGALFQGYRVAEVPTVMRQRISGTSKKGGNLFYGLRYARVIRKTWWRERHAASRPPSAAGVRQSAPR